MILYLKWYSSLNALQQKKASDAAFWYEKECQKINGVHFVAYDLSGLKANKSTITSVAKILANIILLIY